MSPKARLFALALAISLPLDQLTKLWISRSFAYGEVRPVVSGWLDWTYVRNPGGAFSLFADGAPELRLPFFIGTSLLAIGMLVVFFVKLPAESRWSGAALGAVLGGALGNLIDRLAYGGVVDWIDVHLTASYTWPTFNVADSCIVVGVIVLLLETFFEPSPTDDGASAQAAVAKPASAPD